MGQRASWEQCCYQNMAQQGNNNIMKSLNRGYFVEWMLRHQFQLCDWFSGQGYPCTGAQSAQAATAKVHRLGGYSRKQLCLMILEAGTSKIKVPADSVSNESCFLATFVLYLHMVEREGAVFPFL